MIQFRGLGRILALSLVVLLSFSARIQGQEADAASRTGRVAVLCSDDFERGRSETTAELESDGAAGHSPVRTKLRFPAGIPSEVTSGTVIRVHGRPAGEELVVMAADGEGGEGVEVLAAAPPLVGGEQKTLVLLVNFLDKNITYTVSDVHARVFTDATSVDKYYQEASFGQLWMTGETHGPYTINYSSTGSIDTYGWASAADAAATSAGVPVSTYPRRVYLLPAVASGWSGLGTIGGNPSRAWVQGSAVGSKSVIAHEYGHNLGMAHASTLTAEYGDSSDVMGSGFCHPNSTHKIQLGWVPSDRVQAPSATGSYTVSVLETAGGGVQVIRIPAPDGGDPYYVSYRKAVPFGSALKTTYSDKTSVHRWKGGSQRTYVLQALGDGASFTDPTGQFTVTQTAHTTDSATLSITLPPPAAAPPTVRFTPASLMAKPNTTYTTVSLQVTNLDSITSAASTFQVTPKSVPAGWSMSFSPASLTISPGATAATLMTLVVPSGTAAGNYDCVAQVADPLQPIHAATGTLPVTVDTIAPTPPTNLTATASSYTASNARVDLSWNASTDDTGVTAYLVTRTLGGSTWTFYVAGTTYGDLTAAYATTYSYGVQARDAAGNVSSKTSMTVTTPGSDTIAPTCSITAPAAGATVNGTVTISAAATDNVGVTRVEFYVDGAVKGTDTTSPYVYSWDTAAETNAAHSLSAKAYDGAGNVGASATVSVTVNNALPDTTVPTCSISSPAAGATVSGTVSIAATATDNVGVTRVEFYVDGALKGTDTTSPYAYSWDTTTATNAGHNLSVKAYDAAGNIGTSPTVSVTVNNPIPDTTSPICSISAPAAGSTVMGTVTISATATDNVGVMRVEFFVNGNLVGTDTSSPYSFSWNTVSVANGAHSLTTKGYDAAGNIGTSSAVSVTVSNGVIDNTAPSCSVSSPVNGATVAGTVTLSATATDNVGVTKVEFYVDGTLHATDSASPYTAGWNTATSSNGSHALSAKGYDAAGNVGTSATVSVTVNNVVPDTTLPVCSVTAPAGGSTVSGAVNVTATASDNIGVTKVEFYVDGTLKGSDTTSPYSYAWDTTTETNAGHSLQAKAYDAAGNVGTSSSVAVTVDNTVVAPPPPAPSDSSHKSGGKCGLLGVELLLLFALRRVRRQRGLI